jgi:hypothetical protein
MQCSVLPEGQGASDEATEIDLRRSSRANGRSLGRLRVWPTGPSGRRPANGGPPDGRPPNGRRSTGRRPAGSPGRWFSRAVAYQTSPVVACQVSRGAVVRRIPQRAADLAAISPRPAPREMLPVTSRHAVQREIPPATSRRAAPQETGMSRQAPRAMPPGTSRHAAPRQMSPAPGITMAATPSTTMVTDMVADLMAADLMAADLMAADLMAADLMAADLMAADLMAADLMAMDPMAMDTMVTDATGAHTRPAPLPEPR